MSEKKEPRNTVLFVATIVTRIIIVKKKIVSRLNDREYFWIVLPTSQLLQHVHEKFGKNVTPHQPLEGVILIAVLSSSDSFKFIPIYSISSKYNCSYENIFQSDEKQMEFN